MGVLTRKGQFLRVSVNLNGRTKNSIVLEHLEHDGLLMTDVLNIAAKEERDRFLTSFAAGVSDQLLLDEAEELLSELARAVALEPSAQNPSRNSDDSPQGSSLCFTDVELWPESVDGNRLLLDLEDTFRRFVALPEHGALTLALWILFTHLHAVVRVSPLLAILSPTKRCGKTTCLSVIAALAPRPLPTSNITAAALFRTIEKFGPTIIVDEADAFMDHAEALRGCLNSGHTRSLAYMVRAVGDDSEPRAFSTWAPKVISRIGALADTLRDRAIVVSLRRRRLDELVEPWRADRSGEELTPLKRQAARWAADHLERFSQADPDVPHGLDDRQRDNWRVLLRISDLAGGPWLARTRIAAVHASAQTTDDTEALGILLLEDLRELFQERGIDRLGSSDIVETLLTYEHRPWPELHNGRPLTTRRVAKLLRPFGIRPRNARAAGSQFKGYLLADFTDAFQRYADLSVPPSQASPDGENPGTEPHGGTDTIRPGTDRNSENSAPNGEWDGGTDGLGGVATTEDVLNDLVRIGGRA